MVRAASFDEQRLSGNPRRISKAESEGSGIPKDSEPETGPSFTEAAKLLGRKGGQSTSEAKRQAQAENCKLGGRPRKYPPCPRYAPRAHQFSVHADGVDRCPCGYER